MVFDPTFLFIVDMTIDDVRRFEEQMQQATNQKVGAEDFDQSASVASWPRDRDVNR